MATYSPEPDAATDGDGRHATAVLGIMLSERQLLVLPATFRKKSSEDPIRRDAGLLEL